MEENFGFNLSQGGVGSSEHRSPGRGGSPSGLNRVAVGGGNVPNGVGLPFPEAYHHHHPPQHAYQQQVQHPGMPSMAQIEEWSRQSQNHHHHHMQQNILANHLNMNGNGGVERPKKETRIRRPMNAFM